MTVHYVNIGLFNVDRYGVKINKDDPSTTINDMMYSSMDHLVIPAADVPNSSNYPSIKAYLKAEAEDGFKMTYMDQTKIITYDV